MAKRVRQQRNVITREILAEELSSLEQRMDAKIESTALSFKEYVDSRCSQVDVKFTVKLNEHDSRFDRIDARFDKLEGYFEQLVGMFNANDKKLDKALW